MKEQTAVEWLMERLRPYIHYPYAHSSGYDMEDLIEQSKQMEKEQTIEDFINGSQWSIFPDDTPIDKIAEQYYNETYGK